MTAAGDSFPADLFVSVRLISAVAIPAVALVTVRSRVFTRSFTWCSVAMPLRISTRLHILTRGIVFLTPCLTRTWAAAVFHRARRCIWTWSAIAACFLVRSRALHAASLVRTRRVVAHLASLWTVRSPSRNCITSVEVCRTCGGCDTGPPVVDGSQKLPITARTIFVVHLHVRGLKVTFVLPTLLLMIWAHID